MLAGQHHDQLVLHRVGVLVLVDQHVLEALAVVREHIGVVAEELDGDRAAGRRSPWRPP